MICTFNNNMQLFQTRGHIVILNARMVHDARIISTTARTCRRACGSGWATRAGIGEGDTLVVETTNLSEFTKSCLDGSSDRTPGRHGPLKSIDGVATIDAGTVRIESREDSKHRVEREILGR